MKMSLITFRSITPAQKAERVLKTAGFSCLIVRTPKWMEEQGCSYSLQVAHTQLTRCLELLQKHRLPYRKVYLRGDNGTMEALEI